MSKEIRLKWDTSSLRVDEDEFELVVLMLQDDRDLTGQAGDVGQARLGVGQFAGRALQFFGITQLMQGIVQLARDGAELQEDFGRSGRRR